MTGKQVMQWILMQDLYDTIIIDDLIITEMFMDETEAAVEYGVGTATIRTWYEEGMLKGIKIGETVLYHRHQDNPIAN